jgi:pyroglutamyl-peptidase I
MDPVRRDGDGLRKLGAGPAPSYIWWATYSGWEYSDLVKTLVTGFEPFGGSDRNPSAELITRLEGDAITVVLPVEFETVRKLVPDLLAEHRPTHVVCLGLSGCATGLTLERVAINLIDARIPDNAGDQPVDRPVIPGAPAARFSTLPVKAMLHAVQATGTPGELSLSAGSYVCNALLYHVLHAAATFPRDIRPRCGFIHVPSEEAVDLDSQERGLRAAMAHLDVSEIHFADGELC